MTLDTAELPFQEPPPPSSAKVADVFSSLQGEGLYLGERQIFVRLAGCPWRCTYCDTPDSLSDQNHRLQTVDEILEKVKILQAQRSHSSVSVTGGEPLLQTDFLTLFLPKIQALGLRVHLETSATHPHLFQKVATWCDVVAADIKLPSAIGQSFWAEHDEFLKLAGEKAFVKIVLTSRTTDEELETAIHLLSRLTPVPPLILQPVTPIADLQSRQSGGDSVASVQIVPPAPERLVTWWDWARQKLPTVKIVPQMHPLWGLP